MGHLMNIIVLGCGPAGLLAVQAVVHAYGGMDQVRKNNVRMAVISKRRKSTLYGAQYLHAPIPGLPLPDPQPVTYKMIGNAEQYRRKVYGQAWSGSVSPEDLDENHLAWDIRAAYDILWDRYKHLIMDVTLMPDSMPGILATGADMVINTVPRPVLCKGGHFFGSTEIWAAGDAPDLGINLGRFFVSVADGSIVCNGLENPSWYRLSKVYQHMTVEWPGNLEQVPVSSAAKVTKPTDTNCDCWPEVMHVGRYGKWQKGVLTHHVFNEVTAAVTERVVKV
jgi:hypothetical protein